MVYVGKHSSTFPVQCFFFFGPVPFFLEYILCDIYVSFHGVKLTFVSNGLFWLSMTFGG